MMGKFALFPLESFGIPDSEGPDEMRVLRNASYTHPELGVVKLDHLPLRYMREYFPRVWDLLRTSTSFAIIRHPRDRFISAVAQRLREFQGVGQADLTDDVIRDEAHKACDFLAGTPDFCVADHIHMARQSDFIAIDGVRYVEKLFRIDRLNDLKAWLSENCEVVFEEPAPQNQNVQLRGALQVAASRVKPFYQKTVSPKRRDQIRSLFKRSPLVRPAAAGYRGLALGDDVENFIAQYYRDDFVLFAELGAPAVATGGAQVLEKAMIKANAGSASNIVLTGAKIAVSPATLAADVKPRQLATRV